MKRSVFVVPLASKFLADRRSSACFVFRQRPLCSHPTSREDFLGETPDPLTIILEFPTWLTLEFASSTVPPRVVTVKTLAHHPPHPFPAFDIERVVTEIGVPRYNSNSGRASTVAEGKGGLEKMIVRARRRESRHGGFQP